MRFFALADVMGTGREAGARASCSLAALYRALALIFPDALTAKALIQADRPSKPRIEELMSRKLITLWALIRIEFELHCRYQA